MACLNPFIIFFESPLQSETITFVPDAKASTTTFPKPSHLEHKTKIEDLLKCE